jgi:hypothetical protein
MVAELAPPVAILGELASSADCPQTTLRKWMDNGMLGIPILRVGLYRAINRRDLPNAIRRIRELMEQRCGTNGKRAAATDPRPAAAH